MWWPADHARPRLLRRPARLVEPRLVRRASRSASTTSRSRPRLVLLDVVVPYNVAFKLVTALGPMPCPSGPTCSPGACGSRGRTAAVRRCRPQCGYLYFTGDARWSSRSSAATSPRRWPGSSRSRSAWRWRRCSSARSAIALRTGGGHGSPRCSWRLCVLTPRDRRRVRRRRRGRRVAAPPAARQPPAGRRRSAGWARCSPRCGRFPMVTRLDYATHMGWEPYDAGRRAPRSTSPGATCCTTSCAGRSTSRSWRSPSASSSGAGPRSRCS